MRRDLRFWGALCSMMVFAIMVEAQTFNGQGGLLVPPGAPTQTVGITTSIATVSGIGILGTGCSYIDNVTIDLNHTFDGDIAIFIIAPSGEVLELSSSNGGSGDNFKITVFKDTAPTFITAGFPPFNGTFRPEGRQTNTVPPFLNTNPLGTFTFNNTFSGINADGDWTLLINDYVAIDVGVLNAWSITFAVGGGPAPTVNLGPDVTICPGQSATLTATVTPSANSYAWSTGATTQTIMVSPASTTTYSVTVTNNGCIDADTIQVVVNPNVVTANAGPDVSICQGNSTMLTGSGGGGGATYNWSNGQSGSSISVNPGSTTTYTLTVSDGGCTATDQVTVTVTPTPVAEAGPPVAICDGQTATLTATGGTQNNQYTWSTGQNGATINVNPVTTTTYTVTVNINGCSDTDDVVVTVNEIPTVDAGSDIQICTGETANLTATGSGGTYQWSTGQSGSTITVSPSTTTTYTVTATENGCTATDNVTVTVGNIVAGINPDQAICEGASVTLTATGGNTFEWSTGETTSSIIVSPTNTTTYTVTVTQGSCSDDASVVITVNPVPVATVSPDEEICAGEAVTLIASGGNIYNWSSGQNTSSITVSPGSTTTYTVTVTSNGCSSSASVEVLVNPTPNAFAGADENICEGESVTLTASGGQPGDSYAWSTGESQASINVQPLMTTTYTVTITNQWNCFDTDNVTVNVNPIPNANAGVDQDLCEGDNVTLTATGGTLPSTYQWSIGQSGSSITVSPVSNTTYSVTITIAGCSDEDEVEVNVFPSPVASAGNDVEICDGSSVELTASGGGTYQWSNGQTTAEIDVSPSATTIYTVTVTSPNGCSDEDNVTVTVYPNPVADAGQDQSICEGETTSLIGSGGPGYLWSNGQNTQIINVSPSNTTSYELTVTDANGCSDTDVATVIVNLIPFANAGPNTFIVNGESAALTASGGGTYIWSTGETTNQITVMPGVTTTYSVTVTLNGCSDVDDVTVFVNEAPTVDLGPDQTICAGESIMLDATIAGPFDLEFLWSNGETSGIITVSPSTTTTYSVTATDLTTGLSSVDTIIVNVLTLPLGNPVINGTFTLCQNDVSSYTVNPVTGATMYNWSVPADATITSGQGTTSINVNWGSSTGGQIQVVVSNSCGSLPASIANVIVNSLPVLTGPINGQLDPCADGSSTYSISPIIGADSYQWTITGTATITSGQGTTSPTISWNGSAGGDLCVTASNECGISTPVCLTVTTTSTPGINAGEDQSLCGLSATLDGAGTGTWAVISGPGTAVFSDINSPSSTVNVSLPGVYVFNYSLSQNGCFAEDETSIEFFDVPVIINELTDCNSTNTEYEVSFNISGGTAPFLINGNPFSGTTFNSGPVDSGEPYSFQVTDANGCQSQPIAGEVLCVCSSTAGNMDLTSIEVCAGNDISATYLGGELLDGNDVLGFIFHDGNIPGGIIAWSLTPDFSYTPDMLPGTNYFISVVVGDSGPGNLPQLSDPCLAVSEGTPVIIRAIPAAIVSGNTTICEGSCTSIIVEATGSGTIELEYQSGGEIFSATGEPGIIEIEVCPGLLTAYSFLTISDQFCESTLSDVVEVNVNENVFAGTPVHQSVCEDEDLLINLASALTDADAGGTWTEISAVPSSPGAFNSLTASFNTTGQLSGTYSFQYEIPGLDDCPGSSAIVDVVIHDNPVAFAGQDQVLRCDEPSVLLDGTGSSAGIDIIYSWVTTNGTIDGATDSLRATATSEGEYFLILRNQLNGCQDADTVVVTAPTIAVPDLDIRASAPLCAGDCNGIIEILSQVSNLMFDIGTNNFSSDPIADSLCSGTWNVLIMDSLGCILDTSIILNDPLPVEVSLGPDKSIAKGDSLLIEALSTSGIESYNWFPASGCSDCPSITVSPVESTIYRVEVVDSNQCTAMDEMLVTILFSDELFIPTVFTPNGDGINDIFTIYGGDNFERISSFEIFDRWGSKVFERFDIFPGTNAGWDGTYKGSPVNPGVFVYRVVAILSSGEEVLLYGDLTLIK